MSVYTVKNEDGSSTYYIDITVPGRSRLRETTGIRTTDKNAKTLAKEYHDKRRHDLWREAKLGDRPRYIWQQAALKWLQEKGHKRSNRDDKAIITWLNVPGRLKGRYLDEITREDIANITAIKAKESSNARANRYTAMIRAILRKAEREWNWIERAPAVFMRKEGRGRMRWLTQKEAKRLLELLPAHTAAAAEFSLHTGLRENNVARLKWEQVDMKRKVLAVPMTKNSEPLGIPLNSTAMAILRERQGKHRRYVFTYKGKPVSRFNTRAWRTALKNAGIADFRWHDLRHTWASWMAQSGVPIDALQQLGGWKTISMVQRYRHMQPEHLAEYAEKIAGKRARLEAVN